MTMKQVCIRIRREDKVRLKSLAEEHHDTMTGILRQLVANAQMEGFIDPGLSSSQCRRRGNPDPAIRFNIAPPLGERIKWMAKTWGIYTHQVITHLLNGYGLLENAKGPTVWARMMETKRVYLGGVAQSGEQSVCSAKVGGSTPPASTRTE